VEEDNRQGGTENQEQDEVKEAVGEAMEKDEAEEEEADGFSREDHQDRNRGEKPTWRIPL